MLELTKVESVSEHGPQVFLAFPNPLPALFDHSYFILTVFFLSRKKQEEISKGYLKTVLHPLAFKEFSIHASKYRLEFGYLADILENMIV